MSSLLGRAFGLSRTGPGRVHNEDRFMIRAVGRGLVAAVADGVGGNGHGALAATLAMRSLRAFDPNRPAAEALLSRVLAADLAIRAARRDDWDLATMCTTLTAVHVLDGTVNYVHAGDSRLHHVSAGQAKLVTRDHTVSQRLLDAGEIGAHEALNHPGRNVLRQCLGCPMLEPETGIVRMRPGDALLLCSDGFYKAVDAERLADALGGGLREGVLALAEEARASARDDLTLLAIRP